MVRRRWSWRAYKPDAVYINKGNGVSTCLVGRNRFLLGERAQYEIVQSNKIKSNPHLLDLIEAGEVCENWMWYSKNKDV